VFFNKGACLKCHSVTLDGRVQGSGRLGPDLTFAGATKTREHLRESLLDPSRVIAPAYAQVRAVTKSGQTYRGLLLNEDEYTLHLMASDERIVSLAKADLKSVDRPPDSLMPSYRSALAPRETEDLLSFLCSLRGNSK
jgi:putative heme-binding domain-containing protein